MAATRTHRWTSGWSRPRRVAVAAFGLFMLYVQSLYFTGFYIPEEEYWFPFWTGMTVGDRLISLALASWSNFGLIIASFVRVPGRTVRFGPQHRFGAKVARVQAGGAPERHAGLANPLDRPVGTWTEQDVRTVLSAPAYLEPQHPKREQAQRMVRVWFQRRFGTGPALVDVTGRLVREDQAQAKAGGSCPVRVRAHTRQGGKVDVGAHCRATPAA